jgi:bacterioferritin
MQDNQRAELIAGLNDALAHEYASVIQYRTFASTVRGLHRLTLRPMFAAEIADELGHAEVLADTIVTLGGTPSVTPAPVVVVGDTRAMLHLVAKAEGEAIARYVEHRRIAEALGEHALVVALDEIIADETRHRNEVRLVLDGWSQGDGTSKSTGESGRQSRASVRPGGAGHARAPMAAGGREQGPSRE